MEADVNLRAQTKEKAKAKMAEYEDTCKLSMKLNRTFDDSMYSEYARQFKYTIDPVIEVLCNNNCKTVGSIAEGTYVNGSDIDFLKMDQAGVNVGYNPKEAGTESSIPYLRLTRGPLTPSGYTKLQIYLDGHNCKNIKSKTLQRFFLHKIYRYNLSFLLTNRKLKDEFHLNNMTDHGPAQTFQTINKNSFDEVIVYESKVLPNDMKSWFKRTRTNNWPSKTTCELFKSMGCCYVGVGHSNSFEHELEWRISPTRQELYLMLNLNPTQFRCYILLKLFKKTLHTHCGDGISSYHFKMALFWTIENNAKYIWQPQNLIECVLKCLRLLLSWVSEKKCPNYFIPEENMFETKVMNTIQLETLQKGITTYFQICSQPLLYVIIRNYKKMDAIITSTKALKTSLSEPMNNMSSITEHDIYTCMKYIELIKAKPRNTFIREIQDWVSPHKIDKDFLLEMLEEKLCCLNRTFHLMSLRENTTFTEKDITVHLNDPSKKSCIDYEYYLKLASFAATRGAYSTCDVLTQNVHRMTKAYIYCRCCISYQRDVARIVQNNFNTNIRLARQFINQMSISDILQQFSMCLQFHDTENKAGIVMYPLHFDEHKTIGIPSEMISIAMTNLKEYDVKVIDLVSIHPTGYLYFLQYKNSENMNKKGDMCVALKDFEHMNLISLQIGIFSHPDTILNLLGHIYTTKGWNKLAVNCFRRSLQIEPYYNAVKWHVILLLFCKRSIIKTNNNVAFKTENKKFS